MQGQRLIQFCKWHFNDNKVTLPFFLNFFFVLVVDRAAGHQGAVSGHYICLEKNIVEIERSHE